MLGTKWLLRNMCINYQKKVVFLPQMHDCDTWLLMVILWLGFMFKIRWKANLIIFLGCWHGGWFCDIVKVSALHHHNVGIFLKY